MLFGQNLLVHIEQPNFYNPQTTRNINKNYMEI